MLIISNHQDEEPTPLLKHQPYTILSALLSLGISRRPACSQMAGGQWYADPTCSPAQIIPASLSKSVMCRAAHYWYPSEHSDHNKRRRYWVIQALLQLCIFLAPITGYTHGIYGQAGLEASLDEYLRGTTGNPVSSMITNQLLIWGMSPNGLDVRLSIDLQLQRRADELMKDHQGAVILLNAQSGEILVIASQPHL